jgi:glycerol-3-phosphate cytidylyltransferase-like family protein
MIVDILDIPTNFPNLLDGWVLVDGAFVPIDDGHIDYFQQSKKFGLPVACLLAPDTYTEKKHKVLLPVEKRAKVISSIRHIDLVVFPNLNTAESLKLLKPSIFFKGGDWKNKLPKDIIDACSEHAIQIEYGNMPLNSSSEILEKYRAES